MTATAYVDFETRSRLDVTDVGIVKYAAHPSTRVLCMAYNLTGKKKSTKLWWHGDAPPKKLLKHVRRGGIVKAVNAAFEVEIWNEVCGFLYGWPPLDIKQIRCTAAKARAAGFPGGLDRLCKALKTKTQKDEKGKGLIKLLCVPQRITKANPHEWNNDPELLRQLGEYCIVDVNSEMEADAKLPDMPPEELATYRMDYAFNRRGVHVDLEAVDAAIDLTDRYKIEANKEIAAITDGVVTAGTQAQRIREWVSQWVPIPNLQEKTVTDTIAAIDKKLAKAKGGKKSKKHQKLADIRKILFYRQALGRGSTGKYPTIKQRAHNNRVYETLVYHSAHTGRWAGSGIQTQNFPRPTMKGVDPEEIIAALKTRSIKEVSKKYENPYVAAVNALRCVLTATPGKLLSAADFSAVEARVLMWWADETEALEQLHSGDCLYTHMASEIYGKSYKEIYKGYLAGDFECDQMRFFGKQSILGLGFQMAGKTFAAQMLGYGKEITDQFANSTVKVYRGKYKKVVKLWSNVEAAALNTVLTGKRHTVNGVTFSMFKHWLVATLPSGRKMYYPYAGVANNKWGKPCVAYTMFTKKGPLRETTYGGMMTENIVQAMARDLLRDSMLRLERKGFTLLLTIHDEVVAEIAKKGAKKASALMCDLMTKTPKWAKGVPVGVSGWYGYRYRKG